MYEELAIKRKEKAKTGVYDTLLGNNLLHHESCEVLEDLLKDFRVLADKCRIPDPTPTFSEVANQMKINADILKQEITDHTNAEILRFKHEILDFRSKQMLKMEKFYEKD